MAITSYGFSMSQNSGTPNIITATDTTVGTDVSITKRRIYLLNLIIKRQQL